MTVSTVLVVGATGSIGRLVTAEALRQGFRTRALVRTPSRAAVLPEGADIVQGDLTDLASLITALDAVDAVIFTHGVEGAEDAIRAVSYGGVRDVLTLLAGRTARIVLMSAVGVTARGGIYNTEHLADWKRRAERLVRFSGQPYTIVRPGWFDANDPDEHQLAFRQGDRHHAGSPADGAVARQQIAHVLVAALTSDAALRKTFELVAEQGPATTELEPMFAKLTADPADGLGSPDDADNLPLATEPQDVTTDLRHLQIRP